MSEAEKFAAVLREESLRRADDRYVHHAIIRNEMREMADRIVRWERMEFDDPALRSVERAVRETVRAALREHEALPGLPPRCACGHRGDTKYQRETHLAEALSTFLRLLAED